MKRITLIYYGIWLLCASSAMAQVNLVDNGDFEDLTGAIIVAPPCGYFTNLIGWQATHGTPEYVNVGGIVGPGYLRMWNQHTNYGEGVAAILSQSTHTRQRYVLCFWHRDFGPPANIVIVLHNSAVASNFSICGGPIPNFGASQVVATIPTTPNGGWISEAVAFTPDAAYSRLSIFPLGNFVDTIATIHLDGFELSTCDPSLIVDHLFTPQPAGLYMRTYSIIAGSMLTPPGSPLPVTPNPGVNTTFRAGNYVQITDNFLAQPNPDHFFLAEIGPCIYCDATGIAKVGEAQSPYDQGIAEGAQKQRFSLFPNPTSGRFTLQTDAPGDARFAIYDIYGREVEPETEMSGSQVQIDLSAVPSGTYLVRVKSAAGVQTLRLLRQ